MKKTIIFLAIAAALFASVPGRASAQTSGLGLGVILGEPTGVSLKVWTGRRTAFDVAGAWSFGPHEAAFYIHADLLWHDFGILSARSGRLSLYYGIGGRIKTEAETRIGVRVPLGLSYEFPRAPLDLFVELGPILDLAPKTDLSGSAFVGLRFYF